MSRIIFDNVSKVYPGNDTPSVANLNMEIDDEEFLVMVGPSGCGKSTAMRMVAGLEEISDGRIIIGDRVVNDLPPKDRNVAMVFQSYALYPHMSVRDNLAYPLKLRKVPKAEREQRVLEAARILDIEQYLDRKPKALSGGQRQRVALGRAIVRNADVFLMDEPLSNLDAKLRVQMRTEVAELQSRLGTTTVYVTHDQTEAMTLGDRVAVMRSGLLQQVDTPANLYNDPVNLFVAGFIGSPSMNFVHGEVSGGEVKLPFATLPLSDDLQTALGQSTDGRDVICGLRPEHFEDAELVGDHLGEGVTFEAKIDMVESMGSELYAYFDAGSDQTDKVAQAASEAGLEELAGGDSNQVVTRLAAESAAKRGETLKLWVDPSRLLLFDPDSGERIRT